MKAKMKPYDAYMFHRNASDEQDRFANAALKKGDRETAKIHMKLSKKHADKAIRAIAESLEEITEARHKQSITSRYARKLARQGDRDSMAASDKDDIAGAIRGIAKRQDALRRGSKAIAADHDTRSMKASDKEDIAGAIRHIDARNKALKMAKEDTDMPIMERMEITMIANEYECSFNEARSMYAKMRLAKKYATGGVGKQINRIGNKIGTSAAKTQRDQKTALSVWDHQRAHSGTGSEGELAAHKALVDINKKGEKLYRQDKRVRKVLPDGQKKVDYTVAKSKARQNIAMREGIDNAKIGTPMIDYEKNAETIGNKVKAIVQAQADRYMRDGMDQETRKTLKEAYWDKPANPKQTGWKPRSVKAERERREDKIRAEKTRRMRSARIRNED